MLYQSPLICPEEHGKLAAMVETPGAGQSLDGMGYEAQLCWAAAGGANGGVNEQANARSARSIDAFMLTSSP